MPDASFGERVADFLDSLGFEELTDDYRDEHSVAERALAEAFSPLPGSLAETPEIHEVNKVNVHDDGGDVLVPVVPVLFEDAGEPDLDTVWETVGRVLEAAHPAFEDHHVRHYDIQFAYADAEEEQVIYRRVTVHPPLVERYLRDPSYDLEVLRDDVAAGDNGDDAVPPVNFKQFDAESTASSGAYAANHAAAGAAAVAASSGAAAACAGGAAGGAAGAGGC
jgi:hypothetical protein